MKITVDFSKFQFPDVNRIVKLFILTDLLVLSGWGIINPIFAVFIIEDIAGATIVTVGILAAIYFITRSFFQVPISLFLDKYDGERDDFYAIIFGLMIISVTAFSFMLAKEIWHIYLIVFLKGIGFALYAPPWTAIFSRHVDKDHTAFDWAIHSSVVGLSMGVAAFAGGWIAKTAGFDIVFLLVGLSTLAGASLLLFVPDLLLPRKVTAGPTKPLPISITKGERPGHV